MRSPPTAPIRDLPRDVFLRAWRSGRVNSSSRATDAYPEESSLIEEVQDFLRQRSIKVFRNFKFTFFTAKYTFLAHAGNRHQPGNRLAGFRDNYLFSCFYLCQEF